MKKFFKFQFPLIVWAGFIFFLSSLSTLPHIETPIIAADKLAHITVYFMFCLLSHRAFSHQEAYPFLKRRPFLSAFLFTCLYGYSDELHQLYVPGRTYDYFDMLADATGALLFIVIFLIVTGIKRKRDMG